MDFGAFVRLEPGIEGLIHISELSHRRVFRAGDVLQEGQQVEVLVLSVDAQQQRISLSLKAPGSPTARRPPSRKTKRTEAEAPPRLRAGEQTALKGGIGGNSGGDQVRPEVVVLSAFSWIASGPCLSGRGPGSLRSFV